jgi:predicted RNase H-like nuclease (RuvC/YqgF family)
MDVRQVGEAALRERAQEVERRGGLVVALHESLRVGAARVGRRRVGVDDVAAKGWELDSVDHLRRLAARLRKLARDPPHLHDRNRRAVGQHSRHLEQHLELLADRRSGDVAERLDAVTRLEEERTALGHLAERREQRSRLTREDKRRQRVQSLPHRGERGGVRPLGLLSRRELPPRGRRPGRLGDCHWTVSVDMTLRSEPIRTRERP